MGEPLILDPYEPSDFRPAGSAHGGDMEILNEPIDVGTYDDFGRDDVNHVDTRGSRPSMVQKLSGLGFGGGGGVGVGGGGGGGRRTIERRPSKAAGRAKRDSVISSTKFGEKYQFYRFDKEGPDWQYARRRTLVATQSDMEKQIRKWKGSVLDETKRMGELRSSQLERLVNDVNAEDSGDGAWIVALIESTKTGAKCTRMDVILARSKKPKSPMKSSAAAGQLVDIFQPTKNKAKEHDKKTDKWRDDDFGDKKHDRKDSVLDDPFQESILFDRTGKPMDDRGVIEFSNGGLPPEIPHDKPIGWRPDADNHKMDNKRGTSKDRGDDYGFGDDAIVKVDEHIDHCGDIEPIEATFKNDDQSRRGSRSRSRGVDAFEPIEVEPGRSQSRRRQSSYHGDGRRMSSRRRSMSRPDGIRFPPQYDMGRPPSDVLSSTSSDESRYGLEREERSSYTSRDTYDDLIVRRNGYDDGHGHGHGKPHRGESYSRYPPEKNGYKEHHRGPSVTRSRGDSGRATPRYNSGADVYEMPAANRRRKSGYYADPIPEDRRIGFSSDPYAAGPLVRRSTYDNGYDQPLPHRYSRNYEETFRPRDVKLHYPGEDMVDLKAREREFGRERYVEDYQSQRVKDDVEDRRERSIGRREERMDDLEGGRYYGHGHRHGHGHGHGQRDKDRDGDRYRDERYDDGYYR